jgi:tRNA dimethylallyltransferase
LEREEKAIGLPALYERLQKIDPARAASIKPADKKRIVRALEVLEVTARPQDFAAAPVQKNLSLLGYEPMMIGLQKKRPELYRDIERRVDAMFRRGLVGEVRRLARQRISETASQALGYKEILDCLRGAGTLAEARDLIKKRTRHFAKRQMTWFRREPVEKWFWVGDADTPQTIADEIAAWLRCRISPEI